MKKLSLILMVSVLFTACKKSSNDNTAATKYMDLTTGNQWSYKSTDSTNTPPTISNYTLTAGGSDTTVDGLTFNRLNRSTGGSEFYNITGNNYYTLYTLPSPVGVVTALYLKDNATTGTSWEGVNKNFDFSTTGIPFPGLPPTIPINVKVNYTVIETGISRTVNGTVYNNVMHIKSVITPSTTNILLASTVSSAITSEIHQYYAPKYGLIESKTVISSSLISGLDTNSLLTLESKNF